MDFSANFEELLFSHKEYAKMDKTRLKKHIHPFYELLLIERGELEYAVENRYYMLKEGDMLLIRPAQYHFVRRILKAPYRRFCFNFTPEHLTKGEALDALLERGEYFSLRDAAPVLSLLSSLQPLLEHAPAEHTREICRAMLNTVLLSLDAAANMVAVTETAKDNFQRIVEHIHLNLTKIQRIEDVCESTFFSPSYVSHLFKKELNLGVMQYIRNKRVLLAHQRIVSGEKPTDVYAECGFPNYVTFYRAYLRYFGFSPSSSKP